MTELKDIRCQICYVEFIEMEQELIEAGLPKEVLIGLLLHFLPLPDLLQYFPGRKKAHVLQYKLID